MFLVYRFCSAGKPARMHKWILAFLSLLPPHFLEAKPNIVILFADDMGYSDIGCYGSEIQTPNLDQLAANGLRLSHFYNTGRCCPSRASILTGLYPHQANIGHMAGDTGVKGYRDFLSFNSVTIAEVLKTAGYRTMMTGKWHLGWRDEGAPPARGFDRFYGTRGYIDSYYTVIRRTEMYLDNKMVLPITETPINHLHPDQEWYTTDVFTDYALHFMDEAMEMEKPFFLYLAYNAPHFPLHCKPEDLKKYRGSYKAKGWNQLRRDRYQKLVDSGLIDKKYALSPQDSPDWDSLSEDEQDELDFKMSLYAGIIDRLDQNIGRVVSKLKDSGQLDNTLILFVSDNGGTKETGMFGIKGRDANIANYETWARKGGWTSSYGQGWANLSNVPFRLYKRFNHEGGVSTPLIVHWPAGVKGKGTITHQPGHLIDIMATCVDVSGAEYPEKFKGNTIQPMEGRTLRPAFQGDPIPERPLFWEHEGHRAIRDGQWKLVGLQGQPWELYNIAKDRTELKDLAAKETAVAQSLQEQWDAWAKKVGVKTPQEIRDLRKQANQRRKVEMAAKIKPDPCNLATFARPTFSSPLAGRDQDQSIQDSILPTKSADKATVHRSWWPRKGTQEWAQYKFSDLQTVSEVSVYWFHDHPNGGCKVPQEWELLYLDKGEWKPVEMQDPYGLEHDRFNTLRFKPVKTKSLRLQVQLQPSASSGIHEWRVK